LINFIQAIGAVGLVTLSSTPAFSCHHNETLASHYGHGDGYHGRRTASGQVLDAYGVSVAHPSLPMGTKVKVQNKNNGKSVIAVVNDRGPFVHGRSLDLSYGAFSQIADPSQGVARVCYAVL